MQHMIKCLIYMKGPGQYSANQHQTNLEIHDYYTL